MKEQLKTWIAAQRERQRTAEIDALTMDQPRSARRESYGEIRGFNRCLTELEELLKTLDAERPPLAAVEYMEDRRKR